MRLDMTAVKDLLALVESGDEAGAIALLAAISAEVQPEIVKRLSDIIEQVHVSRSEAIEQVETELASAAVFKCHEALEHIKYVNTIGADAANTVLTQIDNIFDICQRSKELFTGEQYKELSSALNTIMIAQGVQDLHGQVLNKLCTFVENMQSVIARSVDLEKAEIHSLSNGPAASQREIDSAISDQDEIDQLLAVGG